ncbi:MAG: hypothetical protein FJX57_20000 [Alphaproteobacteria bacterium]|nr:hypothetical protein [Alphaproteobacteria bacterium]
MLRIPCDTVVFSGDFVPDAPLATASGIALDLGTQGPAVDQFGRTRMAGVFAAGNVLRAVESSGRAAIEGARVGRAVAAHLEGALAWTGGATEIVAGDGLLHAMPQRWSYDAASGIAPLATCLAVSSDSPRVRLRVRVDDRDVWSGRPARLLRKRRLTLPSAALTALDGAARAVVHVTNA